MAVPARIATPAGALRVGRAYRISLRRGADDQVTYDSAVVEAIQPYEGSDEVRYQVDTGVEKVGFLPEHVLSFTERK